jgi:hypothetical protein
VAAVTWLQPVPRIFELRLTLSSPSSTARCPEPNRQPHCRPRRTESTKIRGTAKINRSLQWTRRSHSETTSKALTCPTMPVYRFDEPDTRSRFTKAISKSLALGSAQALYDTAGEGVDDERCVPGARPGRAVKIAWSFIRIREPSAKLEGWSHHGPGSSWCGRRGWPVVFPTPTPPCRTASHGWCSPPGPVPSMMPLAPCSGLRSWATRTSWLRLRRSLPSPELSFSSCP